MVEQEILVLGSGVAGMAAGQYAARAGRTVTHHGIDRPRWTDDVYRSD